MRLAYFSPLNPVPSGISDYSEELLPSLAAQLGAGSELTLVVAGYTPQDRALTAQFPVIQDEAYRAQDYDLALYHLGNSPAHAYIYRRALREPGIIVLHDLVLHHLVAWMTINHGDTGGYLQAMRDAYGDAGARLAERDVLGIEPLNRFDYPLSERVLNNARGVIVHSRYAADAVKRMAPHVTVAQIPHELKNLALINKADARNQLGLDDSPLVGSFGNLGPSKRTTVLLDAFREVRRAVPEARLLLVGAASPNFDAQGLIDLFDLRDAVQLTGHVPFDLFHVYMAAMDACVNLRYPTAGETSGAVLRMMAQAKPVIVSRVGWFAELPGDAVAKIDVDAAETELLTVTLERLLTDAPLREALGNRAREYVVEQCEVTAAANAYVDFLNAVLEGRAESKNYFKEIAVTTTVTIERSTLQASADDTASGNAVIAAERSTNGDWRDDLAQAYAGLGLAENDALLGEVARAIVALGLHSSD